MGTFSWPTHSTSAEIAKTEMAKNVGSIVAGPQRHGGAFWAILEEDATNDVHLLCYLVSKHRGVVYVKAMDASVGPVQSPPRAMLNKYIALKRGQYHGYEENWIEQQLARPITPTVRKGDTIRFTHPLTFTSIGEQDTLTYLGGYLFCTPEGYRVRLPRTWRHSYDYERVSASERTSA